MFILVDHEERENEGDLVIPGQMATPNAVNFMATHGRGLICLALPSEQIDKLKLPLMAATNSSRHETAFTVSIEAREGVTTGISAHDRAKTISVAINPQVRTEDIATPGHVFPLRAKDGGVLIRAGHTEAAVDISRLAGLNPSGVICEIMNDDGSMARLKDLKKFAYVHNLKIGTISDLIAYRRKHDNLIKEVENSTLNYGTLKFFSGDSHTIFRPRLEAEWDDASWSTGSLSALGLDELGNLDVYMNSFRRQYKMGTVSKIRVKGRELYPARTFGTSSAYLDCAYFPSASSFYSIVDAKSNHTIIPFGSGSKLSCDSTSNFFKLRTSGLEPERYYNVLFKVVSGSGATQTIQFIDNDYQFKVVE